MDIVIERVEWGDLVLHARPPLSLAVTPRADGFEAQDETYGISSWAPDLEALRREVEDDLGFCWAVYVQGDPAEMTCKARELGAALRVRFTAEAPHALDPPAA